MKDNDLLNILLKKWELLWNHFKLQIEAYERRRHFVWLLQAAIFAGWYKSYYDFHNCINKEFIIPIILSMFGVFLSFSWVFIVRRDRYSIYLTQYELRCTERQINSITESVKMHKFNIDYNRFDNHNKGDEIICGEDRLISSIEYWSFKKGSFWDNLSHFIENIFSNNKLKSVKFFLDYLIPLSFLFIWIFILFFSLFIYNLLIALIFLIVFITIVTILKAIASNYKNNAT